MAIVFNVPYNGFLIVLTPVECRVVHGTEHLHRKTNYA